MFNTNLKMTNSANDNNPSLRGEAQKSMSGKVRKDIYQEVTDGIIKSLESVNIKSKQPLKAASRR